MANPNLVYETVDESKELKTNITQLEVSIVQYYIKKKSIWCILNILKTAKTRKFVIFGPRRGHPKKSGKNHGHDELYRNSHLKKTQFVAKCVLMSTSAGNIFFVQYWLLQHISMRERGEKVEILNFTHEMSLFSSIFALFHIVANLNDFLPRKTSVGKAHLPNWYLLLRFCPDNTVWHVSEHRSTRSKCYKAIFDLQKARFLSFFAI